MIIYEVNISISKSIYSEYINWLKQHLQEMLTIDGFNSVNVYKYSNDNKSSNTCSNAFTSSVSVAYQVESLDKLNLYFQTYANEMRSKTRQLFQDNISITRRVLEQVDILN